jgi:RNA polymerase sigma factor (sigma-70 family)
MNVVTWNLSGPKNKKFQKNFSVASGDKMSSDSEDMMMLAVVIDGLKGDGLARRKAVELLYKQKAGVLFKFLSQSASRSEAEDLGHEVLIRIIQGGPTFEGGPIQFMGWFWTVARNVRSDFFRKIGRREFVEFDDDVAIPSSDRHDLKNPEQVVLESLFLLCVKQAYEIFGKTFPDRSQTLSWLVNDELDIDQIARILGRTEGATREYLSQCRKKLGTFLDRCRQFR